MSTREKIVSLLDVIPEEDLRSVLILVQGLAEDHSVVDAIELALDKADYEAEHDSRRLTHDEVFDPIQRKLYARL